MTPPLKIVYDPEDAPVVERFNWTVNATTGQLTRAIYVGKNETHPGLRTRVTIARTLLLPDRLHGVTHLNGDYLDCRRENLVLIRHANRHGYAGVRYDPPSSPPPPSSPSPPSSPPRGRLLDSERDPAILPTWLAVATHFEGERIVLRTGGGDPDDPFNALRGEPVLTPSGETIPTEYVFGRFWTPEYAAVACDYYREGPFAASFPGPPNNWGKQPYFDPTGAPA